MWILFKVLHVAQFLISRLLHQATINSIRSLIPSLANTPASRIIISARFAEYGDTSIQIHSDIWSEVLPTLKSVEVSIDEGSLEEVSMSDVKLPVAGEPPPNDLRARHTKVTHGML
jgi:hypothetical protein